MICVKLTRFVRNIIKKYIKNEKNKEECIYAKKAKKCHEKILRT